MINVFQPTLGQAELLSIADSFNTGWIGKGPKVAEFEAAWAAHIGASEKNVVSTNSCTEALFASLVLLGVNRGDEVIIPTVHFIGAAQAVLALGAFPVFCDVGSRTLNATVEFIQQKITNRTRAVILNHYGGVPCEMDGITSLLSYHPQIKLIEDAACAPASTYGGKAVGTFGDIGAWSFDAMKIISTGDGGMMYVKDEKLADKARKLLYLGIDTESGLSSNTDQWWKFGISALGARRSVMNDLAAGMGLEQLKRLGAFANRRIEIIEIYGKNLEGVVSLPPINDWGSLFYFYWIQTPKRDELAAYLKANGVYTTFRYYPLHWAYGLSECLPNAEQAANNTLLLPLHCNLTDEQVEFICEKIRGFYL